MNVDHYHLYVSLDGENFNPPLTFSSNQYNLLNLSPDTIAYVKLTAENTVGTSGASELLAALSKTTGQSKMLVINGFDRPSTGNTFDFIRQHAASIVSNGVSFESATNDAVVSDLFALQDYPVVDYILGDESTYDESFSTAEQILVSEFLMAGGRLFVSGEEIAWDLDYKGSASDKAFMNDYLKAQFSADALIPINGSMSIIRYKNVSTHTIGGVSLEDAFKNGSESGKLVYLGFPFETIYPASIRDTVMENVLFFLFSDYTMIENITKREPDRFYLAQNFPNPFNPSTTIEYHLPKRSDVTVTIYNSLGVKVREWKLVAQNPGIHSIIWDGTNSNGQRISSGTYFYRMFSGEFIESKKLVILK